MTEQHHIAVIGAGPAGLMAAEAAAGSGAKVTLYDRMPSAARKFLMAGRGGLNLTHSEPLDSFLSRYGAAEPRLRPIIEAFPPEALRTWAESLGQKTFVGSSGRVFPESFKASPLLRAWLRRLAGLGVELRQRHRFLGFDGRDLLFAVDGAEVRVHADATVLALGGASWSRLGSDGSWVSALQDAGVTVAPLLPANAGVEIDWSDMLRERFSGQPVKPLALTFSGRRMRGEAVVTRHGLEGGAVYALCGAIRDSLAATGEAVLELDLRPDVVEEALERRLSAPKGRQSTASQLRKAGGLTPVAAALLREAGPLPSAPEELAHRVKHLRLPVRAIRPIERAISTAGGVAWAEVDDGLMLTRHPGVFLAGEMLDWEAPTGGYLLQACFATGHWAGLSATNYMNLKL
jgi:uncharacterized flavoprotein (TIGR03862 family)